MAIGSITVGDESGDGHSMTETYLFEVPDQFTEEVLLENYRANVEKFGFDIESFANEYEDWNIPREWLDKLFEAGLVFTDLDNWYDEGDDKPYGLAAQGMFEIAIFFFGHGLGGFQYKVIKPEFRLTGYSTGIWPGYGLFV